MDARAARTAASITQLKGLPMFSVKNAIRFCAEHGNAAYQSFNVLLVYSEGTKNGKEVTFCDQLPIINGRVSIDALRALLGY